MKLARIVRVIPQILLLVLVTETVSAQDLTIFDSRRPVAFSASETTYRDYYINGGVEHGVKKGMILTVTRRLTLYDSYRANSPKELMVEVGRIKIIYAQKGLSVARYYGEFARATRTTLENNFIMVGDKVDMSSALMESQLKKKSASKRLPRKRSLKSAKKMASSTMSLASETPQQAKSQPAEKNPVPLNSLQ